MKIPKSGLYVITQTEYKSIDRVVQDVAEAIEGGAAIVQYRDKNPIDAHVLGSRLLQLCRTHQIPLIINDDIKLAKELGADGVHLGRDDAAIAFAQKQLGPDAIIGVSCYDSVERAQEAEAKGVSYVAFGRFFPSGSKPLAAPAHVSTLVTARQQLSIPVVAIGGILPGNGAQLLAAGADILAVIGGVFDRNPKQSAEAYSELFRAR